MVVEYSGGSSDCVEIGFNGDGKWVSVFKDGLV